MIAYAGAENDPAAGSLTQIDPLIGMPPDAGTGTHLLQAGDVRVDFAQHSHGPCRIVTSVDADAGMNVVGHDPHRSDLLGDRNKGAGHNAIVLYRPPPTLGISNCFQHFLETHSW